MKRTTRGFAIYGQFSDSYAGKVRIQKSSNASGRFCWVFIDSELQACMPDDGGLPRMLWIRSGAPVACHRTDIGGDPEANGYHQIKSTAAMHLNVEQAKKLRLALDKFIRGDQ